jgi:hypothetical protein
MATPQIVVSQFAFLGPVEYWALAAALFLLLFGVLLVILIILSRKTHALLEWKAMLSGKRLVLFFDDNRTVHWKTKAPSANLIEDDDYGTYIINEKGTYIDKVTRNVVIPFSTNLAVGAPVRDFKTTDDLQKVFGDESKLQSIRLALANGDIKDDDVLYSLRESVNFSSLKSLSNTLIPHNITAKINMEIAKRMKGYGNVNGKQLLIWTLIALGCIALMALVLYLTLGGKGSTSTTVIQGGAAMMQNASYIAG